MKQADGEEKSSRRRRSFHLQEKDPRPEINDGLRLRKNDKQTLNMRKDNASA